MAVVIETTLGDITVDLYLEQRPVTCLNFLKLCKMKYYNFNLFHSIRSGFIAQTGDPTGEGSGGESIWGILEGPQKRFFSGEKMPKIRHTDAGLLSMVCSDDMMVGSQFFFTLAPDLNSLDGTHCVIGEVTEGHEVLTKINEVICDETYRPYRDVRITHTVVLEDPFSDPVGLRAPSRSPSPSAERLKGGRIAPDEEIDETQGKSAAEIQELIEEKEAKARATILEIVGDLPDADIAPPENVLFVCKLNPVTSDDDLEIIFCRFGKIVSCEVIRDKTSGNSLQYAFIEYEDKKSCEDAYFKMDNVLIDDRRIHVDFAQSVSKMRWLGKGRGVQYLDDKNLDAKSRDQRDNNYEKNRFAERENTKDRYNDNKRHHKREHSNDRNRKEDRNDKNDKVREKKYDKNRTRYENRRSRSRSRHNSQDRIKNGGPKKHSDTYQTNKNDHRNNYTSSSNRYSKSPVKNDKKNSATNRNKEERDSDFDKRYSKDYKSKERDARSHHEKGLRDNEKIDKKKTHHNMEPKTPSPIVDRKTKEVKKKPNLRDKSNAKKEKKDTKTATKRKRKESTSSSDSDSTDTSSASSSSSSESDQRKRKVKRKKRKVSTSSSSSDSSDSSTSSSSSSSDTSSSSSDSEPKKKKSKKNNKNVKKSRKK